MRFEMISAFVGKSLHIYSLDTKTEKTVGVLQCA